MTIVKGSKQYRLKVVRDRPVLRASLLVAASMICVAGVTYSYLFGQSRGMAGQLKANEKIASLELALSAAQSESADLRQTLANINLGAEVDRKSAEDVRKEVLALKDELAALKEDNSFYRNLMAPTENKRGLTIGTLEISDTEQPRNYAYKLVMQQLATNHQLLRGALRFEVIGRLEGLDKSFKLRELSEQVHNDSIKLRFKYFQTIEGKLSLPEGFEPERIELVATTKGKKPVTVEKRFAWLVEET